VKVAASAASRTRQYSDTVIDWGGKVAQGFSGAAAAAAALGALILAAAAQPLHGLLLGLFIALVVIAVLAFLALLLAGLAAFWTALRHRRHPSQTPDQDIGRPGEVPGADGGIVGRDKYQIQYQYVGATASRIDYRQEISPFLDFYVEVFVGREKELSQLALFAAGEKPGYCLVEASSGYGKSALVAQLIRRRETSRWNGPG
jgi:hypothetical protein